MEKRKYLDDSFVLAVFGSSRVFLLLYDPDSSPELKALCSKWLLSQWDRFCGMSLGIVRLEYVSGLPSRDKFHMQASLL